MPAAMLRRIPKFKALMIHSDVRPAVLATSRWWRVPAAMAAVRNWQPPTVAARQLAPATRRALPVGDVRPRALPPVQEPVSDPEGVEIPWVVEA